MKSILFIALLFCFTGIAHAQVNRYAVANGNWNQTSTWSSLSGGAPGASIPVAGDVVFIGDVAPGVTVTIPAGYDAACATLNLGSATNGSSSLSLSSATSTLAVSANVIITRSSAANTNILFVNDGTVTVGGSVTLAGAATNANRIAKVSIADGSMTISSDLVLVTGSANSNVIDMSGGSGTLTLGGAFSGTAGSFLSGTTGKVIYNKAGVQTIASAFGDYNKLVLAGSGAKTVTGITVNDTLSMQGTATTAGTAPTFGAAATLEYAGSASQSAAIEFRSPFSGTGGVVINNPSGVVLSANKTVTYKLNMLQGQLDLNAKTLSAGDLEGSSNITTGVAGAITLTVGSDDQSTAYSGSILNGSGTITLVKTGSGTMTVSGNSTYSGNTTISEGILKLAAAGDGTNSPLGTATGGTIIANGCVLDLNGITLSTSESLSLRGTGISGSGALINSSTTAVNYAGLLSLTSSGTIMADVGDINLTNTGTITGAGNTLTVDGSANGSIASILGVTSGKLVKNGNGTWTLSGNSTYTGTTTINAGKIMVGASATVFGTVAGITTVNSGACLDLNGYTIPSAEPLTISGTGIGTEGVVINSSSTDVIYSGLLKLAASSTINIDHGSINFSATGTITGGGRDLTLGGSGSGTLASVIGTGAGSLIKEGTGTWTLSGASTFTGTASINAGTIKIGASTGAIPNSCPVTLTGTLDLNGNNETIGTLDGSGLVTSSVAGTVTFSVGTAANFSFATPIEDGSGTMNFTKNGTGTMTAASNSNYSGITTIAAGTLKIGIAPSGINTALGSDAGGTTITSGASLDLNGYSILTDEALTIKGTGISSGGALTNTDPTASTFSGLLTLGATSSIVANAGDINLPNTGTITGSAFNLTLNGTASGTLAGDIATGSGTLTKSGTGTWTLSGTNTYTGATTISAGILKLGASTSVLGTIAGITTVSNGASLDLNGYTLSTAEPLTINGTGISSSGALTNTAAGSSTYPGLLKLGSASSVVTSNGPIVLNNAGTITGSGFNLTLDGTGTGSISSIIGTGSGKLFKSGTGTWTVSGTNTFTGGTTLNDGTLNINSIQALGTVASTFTIAGGTIDNTTGASITTLNYPQAWSNDFSFTGTQDLNLGTGTITMGANITVNAQAKTLTTGGTLSGANYTLTKTGAGNLYSGANTANLKDLTISAGTYRATSGTMNLSGDLTNNSILLANNGLVNFNGTLAQNVSGSGTTGFYNMTLNNLLGLTMSANASIGNTLTITNGILAIETGNTLNITSGNAISGTGFGVAKQVNTKVNTSTGTRGALRVGGFVGSYTFPIGNGTYYLPMIVNATGSNDFTLTVYQGATQDGQPNGPLFPLFPKLFMVDANWMVARNTGSSATTLQAFWPAALEGIGFSDYLDNEIGLSRNDGSGWDVAAGSGSQSLNNAARNTLISFGTFDAGKVGVPLAMIFRSVKVTGADRGLKIDWTVLNESDIDHYEVQRSTDGTNFRTIGDISNSGRGMLEASYSYIDASESASTYYYRIKAIATNGKPTYSPIVRADLHQNKPGFAIYPNPVQNGQLSFHAGDLDKGNYLLAIYNSLGQQMMKLDLSHPGGSITQTISLPRNALPGMYILRLEKDQQVKGNYTFIVR